MTEMGEQEDEDDGTKECRVSRVRRENGRQCLNTRPHTGFIPKDVAPLVLEEASVGADSLHLHPPRNRG